MGGFNRIEIFALDVLNQGEFEHPWVIDVLNDDGHFSDARQFGSAPSSFPSHDLIPILMAADNNRLDNTVRTDGGSEFV
jgi:hypothetical protein